MNKRENATIHGLTPFLTPFSIHGLTLFVVLVIPSLPAQDLDLYVRSVAADGRIRVVAREAEWVPRLSVWSERSMERLEKQWKVGFPFQADAPLEIRIGENDRPVELAQVVREKDLYQRIWISAPPEEVSAELLGQVFVDAALTRLQWAVETLPVGPVAAPRVVWGVGAASGLVAGESSRLATLAVKQFSVGVPPSPDQIRTGKPVHSFLLYRWMCDRVFRNRETARMFWMQFVRDPEFDPEDWVTVTPEVSTLREVHIDWAVWWAAERRMLISEFRLNDAAQEWLLQELTPVPRMFGLDSPEGDPHLSTAFTDFEPYLDHPALESALVQWIYRLQAVRFRQPQDFDAAVKGFESAIHELLYASRAKGAARKGHWETAVDQWYESLRDVE